MDWNFSIGWFILGVVILIAGVAIVANYQKIADTWLSGVSSYDKTKLVGIITMLVGFVVMANLHTLILSALVKLIFVR